MALTISITSNECKNAFKKFGTALNNEIIENFKKQGKVSNKIIEILENSLISTLESVCKKVKKEKKDLGLRKRFQYEGIDQIGENGSFLRIRIDRDTRIVSKVNYANWTEQSQLYYNYIYGTSTAYIIPARSGSNNQIIVTQPYQKEEKKKNKKKKNKEKKRKEELK